MKCVNNKLRCYITNSGFYILIIEFSITGFLKTPLSLFLKILFQEEWHRHGPKVNLGSKLFSFLLRVSREESPEGPQRSAQSR